MSEDSDLLKMAIQRIQELEKQVGSTAGKGKPADGVGGGGGGSEPETTKPQEEGDDTIITPDGHVVPGMKFVYSQEFFLLILYLHDWFCMLLYLMLGPFRLQPM